MRYCLLITALLVCTALARADVALQSCISSSEKSNPVYKIRVSQGVQRGMILSAQHIDLSKEEAKLLRAAGELKIAFKISKNGAIECYELQMSPPSNLSPEVVASLKKGLDAGFGAWRFRPYYAGGRNVEVETTWEFEVKNNKLRYRKF